MTSNLQETISSALDEEASTYSDPMGNNVFISAYERIESIHDGDKVIEVLKAFISVAANNIEKDALWWRRYINLLSALRYLKPDQSSYLYKELKKYWPIRSDAKAYLVRGLVEIGCPLTFSDPSEWDGIYSDEPLIIVDAMIKAKKLSPAVRFLREARATRAISPSDVASLKHKWIKILPQAQSTALNVALQAESEYAGDQILDFLDKIRSKPVDYQEIGLRNTEITSS